MRLNNFLQLLVPMVFESKTYGHLPKIQSRRFWGVNQFGYAAYKTDGEKDIQTSADLLKELNEIKTGLEAQMEQKAGKAIDEKLEAVNTSIEELKNAKPGVTAEELNAVKDDLQTTIKALDIVQVRMKNSSAGTTRKPEEKSFNEILGETIERHANDIKNFKKGAAPVTFDMLPEHKEVGTDGIRSVKAVGDMSASVNFPASGTFTQDVRNNMIEKPYNRVWLADVLPQGTSNGSSIIYPKENGGEGGAALWTDPTADKVQMDFDFTTQTAYFKWIAGWVVVAREMLDDIGFMSSYIQSKMLISLKIAENDFILNGSTDTNPVQGMLDVATVYHGGYSNDVDRIIDAGWGQIVTDTFDFYNPTHVILTPNDAVKVMLNKAAGSGEYDLPNNSVQVANSGALSVSGIDVVRTTQIGGGNMLVFDRRALMFIRRMQPELRMFEDAVLAKKNKIMFRVEERATLAIFNNLAIVSGGTGS